MLKQSPQYGLHEFLTQPPLRGCVLKLLTLVRKGELIKQPPLRGCVLKPFNQAESPSYAIAAASARLCVETPSENFLPTEPMQPPLRGCVLKPEILKMQGVEIEAAASARLCVETSGLFTNAIV